jgi:hypothetical protein
MIKKKGKGRGIRGGMGRVLWLSQIAGGWGSPICQWAVTGAGKTCRPGWVTNRQVGLRAIASWHVSISRHVPSLPTLRTLSE